MKLSNKILIGFFGFLLLYLTAVFAEVRFRGRPAVIDDSNSIAETVALSGISFLVLQDLKQNINVIASGEPRLEVRSFEGDVLRKLEYNVSGDTLTMSGFEADVKAWITVFVPESGLKALTVNSASATVDKLDQDRLFISQQGGYIWMQNNTIGRIDIRSANDAHFECLATALDTLSASMENSEVIVAFPVRLVEGSMTNASYLRVMDAGEIRFKKDRSSKINIF